MALLMLIVTGLISHHLVSVSWKAAHLPLGPMTIFNNISMECVVKKAKCKIKLGPHRLNMHPKERPFKRIYSLSHGCPHPVLKGHHSNQNFCPTSETRV